MYLWEHFQRYFFIIMKQDIQIAELIKSEENRQLHGIELIASENFVTPQVLAALGSVLTNKYAEGYPDARYYGGCEVVDQVEQHPAYILGYCRNLWKIRVEISFQISVEAIVLCPHSVITQP